MTPMTIPEAANRVRRSERQVKRWIADGALPAVKAKVDGRERLYVEETMLLTAFRQHLLSNPARRRPDDVIPLV